MSPAQAERPSAPGSPDIFAVIERPNLARLLQMLLGQEHFTLEMGHDAEFAAGTDCLVRPRLLVMQIVQPFEDNLGLVRKFSSSDVRIPVLVLGPRELRREINDHIRPVATRVYWQPFDLDQLVRDIKQELSK